MPSPFPGMNPYLEHPALWAGIHHWLIITIAENLVPQLRPRYRVAVEVRTYESSGESLLVGIPDVAVQRSLTVTVPMPETVKQGYLEIREVATRELVTAIELLSPVNKRSGEGRKIYETKRLRVARKFNTFGGNRFIAEWETNANFA